MTNNEKIINEAKRIEEDSLYSAKAHFSAGHLWGVVNFWLGTISAVLSAMAGASALSQFFYHNIIAGVLSIIVAGLAAIITFINPDKRSIIYKGAGNKYKALQNNARIFYEIEVTTNGTDDKRNLDDLKKLNDERNNLNMESPQIPEWAFKKAKKGIEKGEAEYKVDK